MPKFDTPEPISVTVDLGVGHVRFAASDRADTVVDVRPTDDMDESDIKAAKQIRVDYSNGTLTISGPKMRAFDFSRKSRSADVTVELPTGSRVSAEVQAGAFYGTGQLGQARLKTAAGNVSLDRTGPLRINTSVGQVSVDGVAGDADVTTASGRIRLGPVDGTVTAKNSNGDTTIESAGDQVQVRAANGDITVEHAGAGVDAKTSNGAIRIGEVVRGSVVLESAIGDLRIGIAKGTAAWLDVKTSFGHVRNQLETSDSPGESKETVEVRGHTAFGEIVIHRS